MWRFVIHSKLTAGHGGRNKSVAQRAVIVFAHETASFAPLQVLIKCVMKS